MTSQPGVDPYQLRHVRWLAGGTGAGKSTVAAVLARRHGVERYDGDRAEHDWLTRATTGRHPHFAALRDDPVCRRADLSPAEVVASMGGRYRETMDFLVEDMLARRADQIVLVDYFGFLPQHVAPYLCWPGQAVFLLPTAGFRRDALTRRYSDPARARANWGAQDPERMLELRLARDELWDAEVRSNAELLALPILEVDGSRDPDQIADEVARLFRLTAG